MRLERFCSTLISGAISSLSLVTTHFSGVSADGSVLDGASVLACFLVILLVLVMLHKVKQKFLVNWLVTLNTSGFI